MIASPNFGCFSRADRNKNFKIVDAAAEFSRAPEEMASETKKRKRAADFFDAESDAEDDQAAALLEGLESSDEEHVSDDGLKEGIEIPAIPATKRLRRQLKKAEEKDNDTPGIIYVG